MARPWEFRQVGSWEDQAMVNELLQNFSEPERKGFMISGRVVVWGSHLIGDPRSPTSSDLEP